MLAGAGRVIGGHQVDESGADAHNLVMDSLQSRQKLLGSKIAEGIAALELGDVQCHS